MYDRHNPFLAKIKSRHVLNKEGASRETWHFVLDIHGSHIEYEPGDSIAIFPQNDHTKVMKILSYLDCSGQEMVGHTDLYNLLLKKVNLSQPTKKLIQALNHQVSFESDEAIKHYIENHDVEETLRGKALPYDVFVEKLSPLLPRFYSIASSRKASPHEIHLTVARVVYHSGGVERRGICSHFLCDQIGLNEPVVPIYLQKTRDFRLPDDDQAPIIMIGPGTGVAPFRAFMQERFSRGAGSLKSWLFFGERHEKTDFFYEEFWRSMEAIHLLKVDTAFSRDQEEKVYVQHKMWQKRKEFWQWLEEGAILYVCGDAGHMAKDVEQMLGAIIQVEGGLSPEATRDYIKSLRSLKRYLRDVY